MSRLAISLLGPIRVTLKGEPITRFEADTARALLAYLVLNAETPQRRESLVGLLWPEQPEATARRNLRQALKRLRVAIGDRDADPPFLKVTRKTIQFNPDSDYWLDVTVFNAAIASCQTPAPDRDADQPLLQTLSHAAELYRGDLLAGFSLPSLPFEQWLVTAREQLHHQALGLFHHLATYHERRRAYDRMGHYARRQLGLEPWREVAHRQLMRALALSGQRDAALLQYERCRCTLARELGVEPAAKTTALYGRIRDEAMWHTLSGLPPHNIPASLTPFVGRENEMAAIDACLRDPGCRLLTLVGPGGIGKTRLALEAAALQLDAFAHGVYVVPLAALQTADHIVPTIAQALGFSFHDEGSPRQQLLAYVRQKHMLLLLDNLEHLLDRSPPAQRSGADLIVDLLRTAPGVKVLATSRARLNVHGEQLYPVGGMDSPSTAPGLRVVPRPASCTPPTQYSSVKLFLRSARRVCPGFEPTADDLTHIAHVCALVEGIPLAILLAAAWMELLAPAEIAAQISDQGTGEIGEGLDFLVSDLHGLPERQRSMRAVFDSAWRLLTEREREVLQALSTFRGGFTWPAAAQIAAASLDVLRALVHKSLLERSATGRYALHELVRQYAAGKLDQNLAARKAVHDRHSAYYGAALQRWDADLKGPRQQTALEEMDLEIENARAAWNWAARQGQVERLEQAVDGLCLFYEWHGLYQEGKAACRVAAHNLTTPSGNGLPLVTHSSERVLAKISAWQGAFENRLGHAEVDRQLLNQSLALLEEQALKDHDIRSERGFCLLQMGHVASDSNREQAKQLYEQSLALFEELGDRWAAAIALYSLGEIAENQGAFDEAKQLLEESLVLRQALGDHKGIASSLSLLGNIVRSQGQFEEAECLIRESLALHKKVDNQVGIAQGLLNLGVVNLVLGRLTNAHSQLEESVTIYSDLGLRGGLGFARSRLGLIKTLLGRYEQAHAQLQTALSLSQETSYQYGIAFSLLVLGMVALAEERYVEAQRILQESAAVFQAIGQRDDPSTVFALLAYAARGLGDPRSVGAYLSDALQTATEIRAIAPPLFALPAIALLLADHGDLERAVELLALVTSRYPVVDNSHWFKDVARQHIAAVAATLPPGAVAAAQERGRARDLWATVEELLAELGPR